MTITPGVLRVASALPDPPFEVEPDRGFDADLIRAICRSLSVKWELTKYAGEDFNGIFDGLGRGYDVAISGTTITPTRERVALFSEPYLEFNQGIAVNATRHPEIKSIDDLKGLKVGIQIGNTSDAVARKLLAEGKIAGIKHYPYSGIGTALDDLSSGRIGAVIKLFPVISWLIKDRPDLAVITQVPTHEKLGIAFAKSNPGLRKAVNAALTAYKATADFSALCRKWRLVS